jgi:hypothetical protein
LTLGRKSTLTHHRRSGHQRREFAARHVRLLRTARAVRGGWRKAMAKDYLTVGDVLTAFHETREALKRAEALLEKVSELTAFEIHLPSKMRLPGAVWAFRPSRSRTCLHPLKPPASHTPDKVLHVTRASLESPLRARRLGSLQGGEGLAISGQGLICATWSAKACSKSPSAL